MQPDTVTLPVDEENDGVGLVNHIYTRFTPYENRTVYMGPNHSPVTPNTLTLYRTFPKVSGNFRGVSKTSVKFSETVLVDGADGVAQLSAPIICEVSFSIPVGVSAAQTKIARQRALALLDLDSVMAPLNDQQLI